MSEYIVFVAKEHYNPLGIIRTLGESGINPIVICVKGDISFIGYSKYVKKAYYVNSPEEGLELIIKEFGNNKDDKSYILTGDDVVVSLLDKNYDILKNNFYFYNAGENGRINYFMNKDNMFDLVMKHGIKVAKTWKIKVGEIPQDIKYPVMTKAINSTGDEWKDIVFICNNEYELMEAFENIKSENILIQTYINKKDEVSFDGFSINKGRNVFIVFEAYQKYNIPDKYSPYWEIKNPQNTEIINKIENIISELALDGIFEFEFMIDENDQLWFLEINFRNTALGYATTIANMPQVIYWCDSIKNGYISTEYRKNIPNDLCAMAECFDYDVRVKTGELSHGEWIKQYIKSECKLYKGRNDDEPFYRFLWHKYSK